MRLRGSPISPLPYGRPHLSDSGGGVTETEKFLIILMFCMSGWMLSFLRPCLPQFRRIPKRPLKGGR